MLDSLLMLLPLLILWAIYLAVQIVLFNDRQRRGIKLKPVKKTGHWSGL